MTLFCNLFIERPSYLQTFGAVRYVYRCSFVGAQTVNNGYGSIKRRKLQVSIALSQLQLHKFQFQFKWKHKHCTLAVVRWTHKHTNKHTDRGNYNTLHSLSRSVKRQLQLPLFERIVINYNRPMSGKHPYKIPRVTPSTRP